MLPRRSSKKSTTRRGLRRGEVEGIGNAIPTGNANGKTGGAAEFRLAGAVTDVTPQEPEEFQ